MDKVFLYIFLIFGLFSFSVAQDSNQEKSDLLKYAKAHKLKKKKIITMPSGLMLYIMQRGSGDIPSPKQKVSVHYTGKTLDDVVFDSSINRGKPFSFTLGVGQVIKGWDEGIALLPIGSKAILLIPSALAYGTRGVGTNIKPNTPLIFEVDIIE